MKKHFTLFTLATLMAVSAWAQTASRIIGAHTSTYSAGAMVPYDTATFVYAAGNSNGGDAQNYSYLTLKCDTINRVFWMSGNGYFPFQRWIYHHNSANLRDSFITQRPEPPVTGPMVNQERYAYEYNAAGDETIATSWNWDVPTSTWKLYSLNTKTYTGTNLTENKYQTQISGVWVNQNRRLFAYTGALMTEYRYETWDNVANVWVPYSRNTYTYDGSGNNTLSIMENWNAGTSTYVKTNRVTYTYNAANMQTSYIHEQWNTTTNDWQNLAYNAYKYDGTNKRITDSSAIWDATTSVYIPTTLARYVYNAAGLNDTVFNTAWNVATSTYDKSSRAMYAYNGSNQMTMWRTQNWDDATGAYVDGTGNYHYKYYYTGFTGVEKTAANAVDIQLYPNPGSTFINLHMEAATAQPYTVAIYDNMGRLLRQWEEKSGNTTRSIPVQNFDNGNYILTVRGADGSKTSVQFAVQH